MASVHLYAQPSGSSPRVEMYLTTSKSPATLHLHLDSGAEKSSDAAEAGNWKQDSGGKLDFLLSVFTTLDPGVVAAVYEEARADFDSAVSTLEEISGQRVLRQEGGAPQVCCRSQQYISTDLPRHAIGPCQCAVCLAIMAEVVYSHDAYVGYGHGFETVARPSPSES